LKNYLLVFLGPTAIGKTKLAIDIGQMFQSEIISADSRQCFKELKIGTAVPDKAQLAAVKHHFIGHLSITDYYNVSAFEMEVLKFLEAYFLSNPIAVMVGGSGLYIDAVCRGIDQLPDPDQDLRSELKLELQSKGLESLKSRLKELDPDYYQVVDPHNPNRILRALEVCIVAGQPYSSLRSNTSKKRDFTILKIGLNRPREELVTIIHQRVDRMIEQGLVEEVRNLSQYRDLNALNTVGYKEIFKYLDGDWSLKIAIEKIKTNTRRYAKRQLTWFNKDEEIQWFHPDDRSNIISFINKATDRNE